MKLFRLIYLALFSTPGRRRDSALGLASCALLALCVYDNATLVKWVMAFDFIAGATIIAIVYGGDWRDRLE